MAPISSIYGLGLGKMTVKSALNQPFAAEIELVDVNNVALSDVKVGIADPENFEQIGVERAAVLSLLSFKVEKNEHGREVIKVQSTERMSEPYMELVVDLTWPEGQLYKAYTILLDPPGYRLVTSTIQGGPSHYRKQGHQAGVIDKTVVTTVNHNPTVVNDGKKKASYGPTIANDSIWQIAQRYKTSEVILPQVVLAIVGANPDAFTDGNLNGLKMGIRLTIPSTSEIAQVPAELATAEVMAHDKAWNEKQPIEHVLTLPYTNNQGLENEHTSQSVGSGTSTVPSIPAPSSLPLIPSNSLTLNPVPAQGSKSQGLEQDSTIKTEISLTAAVVETVREANALLMEQLRSLQKQNDKLQKQIEKKDKELKQLKSQIQVLVKQRQALPSQASSTVADNSMNLLPLILLLLAGGGGIGFVFWYLRGRKQNEQTSASSTQLVDTNESVIKPRESKANQVVVEPEITSKSELMIVEPLVEQPVTIKDDVISFEPQTNAKQEKLQEIMDDEPLAKEETKDEAPLEFNTDFAATVTELEELPVQKESAEKPEEEYLEFESGLHHGFKLPVSESQKIEEKEELIHDGIEFDLPETKEVEKEQEEKLIEIDDSLSQFFVEDKPQAAELEEESALEAELKKDRLKSKKALETLLALAKTYISMDDFESARHSLAEVIEHGTKKQKDEASGLLESIKDK